jgi:hypothetical protein
MRIWSKFRKAVHFIAAGSLLFFVIPILIILILLFGDEVIDELAVE